MLSYNILVAFDLTSKIHESIRVRKKSFLLLRNFCHMKENHYLTPHIQFPCHFTL